MDRRTVFFFCGLPHSIESNTPHRYDRRTAIYRGGALIGRSTRDERTAVNGLVRGVTAARIYRGGALTSGFARDELTAVIRLAHAVTAAPPSTKAAR